MKLMKDLVRKAAQWCMATHEMGFARGLLHVIFLDKGIIEDEGAPYILVSLNRKITRMFLFPIWCNSIEAGVLG